MDAILQFLIDWGYWGLFLGSFIAGSVLPFSSEAVLAACVGPLGLDPVISITAATAGNVAKMTERHGDRLCNLGNYIHGGHHYDGFSKALQPSQETIIFDVVIPNNCRYHQCPHQCAA